MHPTLSIIFQGLGSCSNKLQINIWICFWWTFFFLSGCDCHVYDACSHVGHKLDSLHLCGIPQHSSLLLPPYPDDCLCCLSLKPPQNDEIWSKKVDIENHIEGHPSTCNFCYLCWYMGKFLQWSKSTIIIQLFYSLVINLILWLRFWKIFTILYVSMPSMARLFLAINGSIW